VLEPAPTEWCVLAVDSKARRVLLAPPPDPAQPAIEPEAELDGTIQRVERHGLFVWLGPHRLGHLARELLGVPPGVDLQRRFHTGEKIAVRVVEIGDEGRRVRLARKGVELPAGPEPRVEKRREEKERPARHSAPPEPESSGTLLGDRLRAALGRPPSTKG
jgi:ribosomal protein S1